jgi:hypothetical protein
MHKAKIGHGKLNYRASMVAGGEISKLIIF